MAAGSGPSTSAKTYERLRQLILEGKLNAGTRVRETDVSDRLGVSRTPVRAALQRLQHEGYLSSEDHDGGRSALVVVPLTKADARELFSIVGALEGIAARRVAGMDADAREKIADGLAHENKLLREEAVGENPEPDELFDRDWDLHQTLVEAGAQERLRRMHNGIKPQTVRYTRTYIYGMTEEFLASVDEHDKIVEALRRGEPDGADLAVEKNWINAAERLCKVIDRLGERGIW